MSDIEVVAASGEQECVEKCEQLTLEEGTEKSVVGEDAKKCECSEKCKCADPCKCSEVVEAKVSGDNEVCAQEAEEKGADEENSVKCEEVCPKDCCSAESEDATECKE
jgi:hypothetical protein